MNAHAVKRLQISLTLNGERVEADVNTRINLVDFVRQECGLTGSHVGCEHGVCGACTIVVDGKTVRGCLMLAAQADGCAVTTVEGLAADPQWADLRDAFARHNALQCGFCTPGMLATLTEFIGSRSATSRSEIRDALSGNYCRCTGYQAIVDATAEVMVSRGAKVTS